MILLFRWQQNLYLLDVALDRLEIPRQHIKYIDEFYLLSDINSTTLHHDEQLSYLVTLITNLYYGDIEYANLEFI